MIWTITADKFLSQDQVKTLIDHLERERDLAIARSEYGSIRTYYIVRLLLETGARCFEFCAIKNEDWSGLKLIIKRGKGGKARTVLLTRAGANLIKEWLGVKAAFGISCKASDPLFPSRYGSALSTRGLRKVVKEALLAAGMPEHLSVHSLRHTNCSLLLAAKAPLPRVRDNLGHSSIQITDLYSHSVGDLDIEGLVSSPDAENNQKEEPVGPNKSTGAAFLASLTNRKRRTRNQK